MSQCCISGFAWDGKPQGKEDKLGDIDVYIIGSPENKDIAIMIIADILGWESPNVRILADHFAKDIGATVFVPDFYDGDAVPKESFMDPEVRKNFDTAAWVARNSKIQRAPTILEAARALKQDLGFKKVGAVGYCYGGWAVFHLGAKDVNLVDAISAAHPTLLTTPEIAAVSVPTQILAPEHDIRFSPQMRDYANTTIPTLGVEYDFQFFPGLEHGFAVRGNPEDKKQREGLERGVKAVVGWMGDILRRD